MKHLKTLSILLVMLLGLMATIPAYAQNDSEDDAGNESVNLIGSLLRSEAGDIIFIDLDGTPYLLVATGDVDPAQLVNDYIQGTLFLLEGIIIDDGDIDTPATIQIGDDGTLEFYDVTTDSDGDRYTDISDNCPQVPNPDQEDTDFDGIGDACDDFDAVDDGDNDGISDIYDNCPEVFNPSDTGASGQVYPVDVDGDGDGDACYLVDVDNDDIPDDEDDEIVFMDERGFYCRNRDVQHPAGGRIAAYYNVAYADLIAIHCGDEDDGNNKIGWGIIRREIALEYGNNKRNDSNRNGNSNGNRNGNGNDNGNGNGNDNGNGNGNGNGRGN